MPPMPEGVEEGILRGLYRFAAAPDVGGAKAHRVPGSSARADPASRSSRPSDLLAEQFGVAAEVYRAPSFQQLRRDALEAERWNRLHPDADAARAVRQPRSCGPTAARSSPRPTG